MNHYVKPSLERKPDFMILHCGTNDLRNNNKTANELADDILALAIDCNSENPDMIVAVSGIIPRNDKLKDKALNVNSILKRLCNARNIGYVDHSHINPEAHLAADKIHPNKKGTSLLVRNFIQFIRN